MKKQVGGKGQDKGVSTALRYKAQQVAGKAGVEMAREKNEFHLRRVIVEAKGERRDVLICLGCCKYRRPAGLKRTDI